MRLRYFTGLSTLLSRTVDLMDLPTSRARVVEDSFEQ